jgi:hypothetical protein
LSSSIVALSSEIRMTAMLVLLFVGIQREHDDYIESNGVVFILIALMSASRIEMCYGGQTYMVVIYDCLSL